MTNRKPADRLHDIREAIRALRQEEAELRAGFLSGDLDPIGDEFSVTVETKLNERINLKEMRKVVPEEIWRPYLVTSQNDRVVTTRRDREREDLKSSARVSI
jgi:hypothetical protein